MADSIPNSTPTLVSLPGATGPVTEIAAGGYHSLALTSTGQLYSFGTNRHGQLGIKTNNKTQKPTPTPKLVTLPGASGSITQIAAGEEHSVAATSTGQLYTWGANEHGQLARAAHTEAEEEANPTPALVSLPGVTTIGALGRGPAASHTLTVVG